MGFQYQAKYQKGKCKLEVLLQSLMFCNERLISFVLWARLVYSQLLIDFMLFCRFGYMMIIIAASLGSILENKGIAPESIPQRPFVAFPQVAYMCKGNVLCVCELLTD